MDQLVIFDCDGVLVDSEVIANRIDAQILTDYGYPISAEECIRKFTGMSAASLQQYIQKQTGLTLPDSLEEASQKNILDAFEQELNPLIKPVLEVLKTAKCIASSSSRDRVMRSLEITGQNHFFQSDQIFTAEQVQRGKPAPDLFLFAAEKMGYQPENCLVIEDSVAGIKAAKAANMDVIAFLGASHTVYDWYKDQIMDLQVKIAYSADDLIKFLSAKAYI